MAEAFDLTMKTDYLGLVWNLGKSKHYGAAKARQRRDFPLGQLGREPLHTDIGKTAGRHRAAKIHHATGNNWQRCKPPDRLQQSQIIGRIHLNHFGVNQARAREQTNLRRILDHMII